MLQIQTRTLKPFRGGGVGRVGEAGNAGKSIKGEGTEPPLTVSIKSSLLYLSSIGVYT